MAITNKVSTITQNYIIPKATDQVLQSNPMFLRMVKKGKKWPGAKVEVPVQYEKTNTASSFSGYDNLPTTATDKRVNMEFEPKFVQDYVTLSKTDISINQTEEKVLDLVETETQWKAQNLADELGDQFYGTGTGGDINGLRVLVDDGTDTANIGGLSRSTYTSLKSTVTDVGGTMDLADWRTMYNDTKNGNRQITAIATTEEVGALYEQLLEQRTRFMDTQDKYDTGAVSLSFKRKPIITDEKCPTGQAFFLNENFMDFRALDYFEGEAVNLSDNIDGNDYQDSGLKGLGFYWTGWTRTQGQESIVGRIVFSGNFIQRAPRLSGRLTGITGV